jgi:hypothetical protein
MSLKTTERVKNINSEAQLAGVKRKPYGARDANEVNREGKNKKLSSPERA